MTRPSASPRARVLVEIVLAAALSSRATPARAEAAPVLNLAVQHCPDIDEVRLRELLVIELATARPRGAGDVDVRLTCSGTRVSLDLDDRAVGRSWRAEVDLADTPAATRLRVLVLAVTEQWSVERAEVEPARPPAPVRPQEPAASASVAVVERAPLSSPASAWRLFAKGSLRRAGRPGLWLFGGGLGVDRALGRRTGLTLDVVAEGGAVDASVATVTMRDVVATAGLFVRAVAGPWSFSAAPGVSVGLATLSATPRAADARGATLDAAWAGPVVVARASRALGRSGIVVAEAGGGLTSRRIAGLVDGQASLFELTGPWLSLGLGAGWSF